MPRWEITSKDGHKFEVTAPEGMPEEQVLEKVRATATKLGMWKPPEPETPAPAEKTGLMGMAKQLVTDPKGFQKQNLEAKDKLQHPAVGAVEGALPSALTAATIPLTGIGGQIASKAIPAAPKIAGAIGEAVTQGALGAGQVAAEGGSKEHAAHVGGLDAATTLATGGILSYIPKAKLMGLTTPMRDLVEKFGEREKAYKFATDSIKTAFGKVADRIPKAAWMNLPSVDRTKRLTAKQAEAALEKLEGVNYDIARGEIISELNRLDIGNIPKKMLGGAPKNPRASYAGQEFEKRTSGFRQKPTPSPEESRAITASNVLGAPGVRAGAETLMTRSPEGTGGMPFGALAANALVQGTALRHVPGSRVLKDVVGDESE